MSLLGQGRPWPTGGWHGRSTLSSGNTHALRHLRFVPVSDSCTEEVQLRAYETVGEARHSIGRNLDFYNGRRPYSSLDDMTPDQAYFNSLPLRLAA